MVQKNGVVVGGSDNKVSFVTSLGVSAELLRTISISQKTEFRKLYGYQRSDIDALWPLFIPFYYTV